MTNSDFFFPDVTPPAKLGIGYYGFSDGLFYTTPEFGTYLSSTRGEYNSSLSLNFTQSQILLARDVTTTTLQKFSSARVTSFLNPSNIHDFFMEYEKKKYSDLKRRFGLNSNE